MQVVESVPLNLILLTMIDLYILRVACYPLILKFYPVSYLGVQKMESMTTGLC